MVARVCVDLNGISKPEQAGQPARHETSPWECKRPTSRCLPFNQSRDRLGRESYRLCRKADRQAESESDAAVLRALAANSLIRTRSRSLARAERTRRDLLLLEHSRATRSAARHALPVLGPAPRSSPETDDG